MDGQTLNTIVEWELQEDMRRAEERAVFLGLLERDSYGTLGAASERPKYVIETKGTGPVICLGSRTEVG